LGIGLAVSWLVTIIFELMESPHNRHEIRTDLWLAATCVALPSLLSRLIFLRFDRRSRTLYYRRVSLLGVRTAVLPFAAIQGIEASRSRLPCFLPKESIVVQANDRVLRFGNWDWLNMDGAERRALLASIRVVVWPHDGVAKHPLAATGDTRLRFSLRRILIAVVLAAVVLGILGWLNWSVQSRCALTALVAGCVLFATTISRWHALLLVLAICYGPFSWMVRVSVPWGTTSGIIESIPIVPATWIGWPLLLSQVQTDSPLVSWLWIVAPIQVLGAAWFASRNGRSALIVSLVAFLLCVAGTWLCYVLYRA
jgi:hypothetical protein